MPAHAASLINALVLIACSGWAYFGAVGKASPTALIPGAFGIALLICVPWIRAQKRRAIWTALALTLVIALALVQPLRGALDGGRPDALLRVSLMIGSCVGALIVLATTVLNTRKTRT